MTELAACIGDIRAQAGYRNGLVDANYAFHGVDGCFGRREFIGGRMSKQNAGVIVKLSDRELCNLWGVS